MNTAAFTFPRQALASFWRCALVFTLGISHLQAQITPFDDFWWKVSSESTYDKLQFILNDVLQSGSISGEVNWQ